MKVFITGGAGFIGSWLTERLLKDGHEVTVMDDLSTGSIDNLNNVKDHPSFRFIQDDIISSPELETEIGFADCIFHLAAAVGVELVVHDPVRTIMTNVNGTDRVLKFAAAGRKRCIVASTSEVYGKSSNGVFTETDDLLIGPSTHSRWSYACSKLLDEFMLMAYHRNMGLNGTVVRFFNTVGPRQTGRYGMVIPRFIVSALKNEPVKVYGDGEQTRCFCHVFDTVEALTRIMTDPRAAGQIFNIGSTYSISIRSLAERIIQYLGSKSDIVTVPYAEAYEKGFEDMLHRAPNCGKMAEYYQWKATRSLDDIIDDTAKFIQESSQL